jgi:hypothetical protein
VTHCVDSRGRPRLPTPGEIRALARKHTLTALIALYELSTQDKNPKIARWARAELAARLRQLLR